MTKDITKFRKKIKESLVPPDLSKYWVDEESPYIHVDKVEELLATQRNKFRKMIGKEEPRPLKTVIGTYGGRKEYPVGVNLAQIKARNEFRTQLKAKLEEGK